MNVVWDAEYRRDILLETAPPKMKVELAHAVDPQYAIFSTRDNARYDLKRFGEMAKVNFRREDRGF